jgi:hypothetical protein
MWIHIPESISCPSALVSEASILDSALPYQRVASCCGWRGKSIAPRSLRRVCETAGLNLLLSGLTCEPSTASRGVESWILSLPASPVSLSPAPEGGEDRTTPAGSGRSSIASFARYDRDSCSLKMCQASFDWDSETSCVTWPKAGSLRNGMYFQRQAAERPTYGDGCSYLPTPRAIYGEHPGMQDPKHLTGAVRFWATPRTTDQYNPSNSAMPGGTRNPQLREQVRLWPTPCSEADQGGDANHEGLERAVRGPNSQGLWPTVTREAHYTRFQQGGMPLGEAVRMWPTPQRFDAEEPPQSPEARARRKLKGGCSNLREVVHLFPTPRPRDHHPASVTSNRDAAPVSLGTFVKLPTPTGNHRTALQSHGRNVVGGQLNPTWVEWLMGWPLGWTGLEPVVRESYQRWLQEHGGC